MTEPLGVSWSMTNELEILKQVADTESVISGISDQWNRVSMESIDKWADKERMIAWRKKEWN